MRIAVVYKSSTGFTERYARFVSKELNADLVKYSERKKVNNRDYDILIFGSSIIAGRISAVEWFDKMVMERRDNDDCRKEKKNW